MHKGQYLEKTVKLRSSYQEDVSVFHGRLQDHGYKNLEFSMVPGICDTKVTDNWSTIRFSMYFTVFQENFQT